MIIGYLNLGEAGPSFSQKKEGGVIYGNGKMEADEEDDSLETVQGTGRNGTAL
jgi:hypothetical protein